MRPVLMSIEGGSSDITVSNLRFQGAPAAFHFVGGDATNVLFSGLTLYAVAVGDAIVRMQSFVYSIRLTLTDLDSPRTRTVLTLVPPQAFQSSTPILRMAMTVSHSSLVANMCISRISPVQDHTVFLSAVWQNMPETSIR
jgi:hypothetical protein